MFGALTRKFGNTFVTAVNSRIGSVEEWLAETRGQLVVPDIAEHLARWEAFWSRSRIDIEGDEGARVSAAYLGLTEDARSHLVDRVMNNSNAEFRWPAFWGPNYDWMPDQCAGGNIQNIIQSMLVQYDGRVIHLLPAWPKEWNAEFKVHAPYRTVLEGRVENGKIVRLEVTPSERMKDVVVH